MALDLRIPGVSDLFINCSTGGHSAYSGAAADRRRAFIRE